MKKRERFGILLLALVLAVSCLTSLPSMIAEGQAAEREIVYKEDFESGVGDFVAAKYSRVRQCEDANGNHYIMVEVDPEKASNVATYKRSANSAGRWGTEFFAWPLEVKPTGFNLKNGKNYQITFEGSSLKDDVFSKANWGTQVLYATAATIWSSANETLPRTAANQIFTWSPSEGAVEGKDGWFYCSTPDNWLKNVGYGTEQTGNPETGYTYTGDSVLSSYQVRSGLGAEIAKVLSENKFYCGKGSGLYDAAGNLKTGETYGTEFKFTLSREDFYGTEAIFKGLTTDEEKNAKMDSYIYEEDGTTLKTYSLAQDCSFLKCNERIAAFKDYLINNPVGFAMDNFTITANTESCSNKVIVGEHGKVSIGGDTIESGESKIITVDRVAGIIGKAIPDEGFKLATVTYGEEPIEFDDENNFKILGDMIENDKILTVTFAEEITSFSNTVSVGEHGKVVFGEETLAAGESRTLIFDSSEGIVGRVIPDENYEVDAVTYDGETVVVNADNSFTVAKEKMAEGKTLTVAFKKIKDAPDAIMRAAVYKEDFEGGTGAFSTEPEARVRQCEDANGNHYIIIEVNPLKAETIATYTRGKNAAGRWGTEFFAWPLQVNPTNFIMKNGKNYKILYEGSLIKGTEFTKPEWGASVLYMNGNTVWTASNVSQPRTAKNQIFTWEPSGEAVSGKNGWFFSGTPDNWLKDAGFGLVQNGDRTTGYTYTGDASMNRFIVRTNLASDLAKVMAENKFYCGGGTGLYDAAGNIKTGQTFGTEFKFTLTRDDFYGTEAIFAGLTTDEEKNAKMDSYIYEEDGKTVKTYSFADDCSFLYCKERIQALINYLNSNPLAYAMDNFTITAEVAAYTNTITVGEHGKVTIMTGTDGSETIGAGESKIVTVDTQNGITGTATADTGYHLASVKYGDETIEVDSKNKFTVDGSLIDKDKTLSVTFETESEATVITKRVVVYNEDFEDGTGTFVTGSEVRVRQHEEENGNHYIVVEVNPLKAKAIATYTRDKNAAGRWGTEFFHWAFEAHPVNFLLQNGKNYQFSFEGSLLKDTSFGKTDWGTNVLYTTAKTIWSSANPTIPRTSTNQLFVISPTGEAVSGKDGWFYCSTPENWLKNVGFGLEQSGDPTRGYTYTGDTNLGYFQVRTNLAVEIAKVMAANKFYCGGGSGLYDAAGNIRTGQTFGTEFKFTLTRDDFYGTEAIFEGLTTDEEKNAKMDSYIYEEDGKTVKTYTLADDCSFLYCKERVREFTAYIKEHPIAYAMDNFTITAEVSTYKNTVIVGEHGQVTVVTDPLSGNSDTVLSGESKIVSADTNNGISGKAVPEKGYRLSSVTYDGESIDFDSENNFKVAGEKIAVGKTLSFVFEEEKAAFSELYIAKNGSDTEGDGSIEHPFATIERARDEIRTITVPDGGITVYLREGTYPISSAITFTSRDSGRKGSPITYKAYKGENVTFTGSEQLDASAIKKVTDETLLSRLSESFAKDHLYMLDLKAQGVTLPTLTASGDTGGERIYMNGSALINARWPNDDKTGEQYFVRAQTGTLTDDQVGKYNSGNQPAVLAYTDDTNRAAKWQLKKNDAFLCGAIAYLWYPQCLKIDYIDLENKQVVTTDRSYYGQNTYTAKTERYLYFENLFEEIDQPGESYLDRESGILYFYPIGSVKDAKMEISRLNDSLVTINGASYLNFDGINFTEGCRTAFSINGNDIMVSNAVIRGLGEDGITASGSRITVNNCDIYD